MNKHGLYKYVYKDKIIYIGKSNANLIKRAMDHKKEDKFKPYIDENLKIYICELPNSVETDILERAMINQYKPILNGTDNQKGFSSLIDIKEPQWLLYEDYAKTYQIMKCSEYVKEDPEENQFFLGNFNGASCWIDNDYVIKVKGKKQHKKMFNDKDELIDIINSLVKVTVKYGKKKRYRETLSIPGTKIDENIKLLCNKIDEFGQWPLIKCIYSDGKVCTTLIDGISGKIKGKNETITEIRVSETNVKIMTEFLFKERLKRSHKNKSLLCRREEFLAELYL